MPDLLITLLFFAFAVAGWVAREWTYQKGETMLMKFGVLNGIFWGVFAVALGFYLNSSWQAWAIILAGNISFGIGIFVGTRYMANETMRIIDSHL